jgi:hypothetical protein
VDAGDQLGELLIHTLARGAGRGGRAPLVETGAGDLQHLTQPLHAEGVPVVLDELEAVQEP